MATDIRMSLAVARVLHQFLAAPDEPHYGYDLMEHTRLPSGTLYPILIRLERAGWIQGAKENIDPITEARPARRYFTLTADGQRLAEQKFAELRRELGGGESHHDDPPRHGPTAPPR